MTNCSMDLTSNLNSNEVWKDMLGFESIFIVSNYGRVKRLKCRFAKEDRLLTPYVSKRGYPVYNICYKGKNKLVTVHRLVAVHFIPNPENKREVNHIDANKLNNSIENLEWATPKENSIHAVRNPFKKKFIHKRGASKGVYKGKIHWRSEMNFNNKKIYMGTFKSKEEAQETYRIKYIELYGFSPW